MSIPCGMKNKGNTCYINTAIQCLAWSHPIRDFFQNHEPFTKSMTTGDDNLLFHFQDIIQKLYDPDNRGAILSINGFLTALKNSSMMTFIPLLNQPNDLHEFYSVFIDMICDRISKHEMRQVAKYLDRVEHQSHLFQTYLSNDSKARAGVYNTVCNEKEREEREGRGTRNIKNFRSSFQPLVEGICSVDIKCLACKNTFRHDEPFSTLIISFPESPKSPNSPEQVPSDLVEMIEANFCDEDLKMRSCDFCKQKADGVKSQCIKIFPEVLTIMIRRYDESGRKVKHALDVYGRMSLSHLGGIIEKVKEDRGEEKENDRYKQDHSQKLVYDLSTIACHMGSLQNGHYYSVAKDHLNNKWILMDDEDVRYMSAKDGFPDSSQFYMLIYEKNKVSGKSKEEEKKKKE